MLGVLCILSKLISLLTSRSTFLNLADEASLATASSIFIVHPTTSISSEATATAGTMSRKSASGQSPVFIKVLSFAAADFAFTTWISRDGEHVIVWIPIASSLSAELLSKIIFLQASLIFSRCSNGVCTNTYSNWFNFLNYTNPN